MLSSVLTVLCPYFSCATDNAKAVLTVLHQSSALLHVQSITGVHPFWMQPELDPHLQVAHGITPSALRSALQEAHVQHRRVAGVLIVSPTYYGAALHVQGVGQVLCLCVMLLGTHSAAFVFV